MSPPLDYEVHPEEAVAILTLNRPDQLNAFNSALINDFQSSIDQAETNDDVRVVIITGAGDEAFSTGYDLQTISSSEETIPTVDRLLDDFETLPGHIHAVWECNKPVIAAINGYCLAGGSDLAMASDIVIASENAQFGYPGIRMGGVPPTLIYPFVMNIHESKELLLSGKIVDAERAAELGMVNQVVPHSQLLESAKAEVQEIRKVPGNNARILKHVINGIAELQGVKPMFKFSEMFDTLGHQTEYGKQFYRILENQGIDAALEYMNDEDKGMVSPK